MKGGAAVADGDRPIVLVPLATARKAARRAGVTLNLSAEDIQLSGKWKHGWIPLDAVASAVKAKRYHGGGGEGRTVKGKGRAGSAVESRREPSHGRTKVKVGAPERATSVPTHRWQPFNNGNKKRIWFLGSRDESLPVEQRYHTGGDGRTVRYASYESAQRAADRLHAKGHFPGSVVRPADPAIEAERAATRAKDAARQSDEARLIKETGSHDPKVWLAHRQEQTRLAGMNFTEREKAGVNPRTKYSAKSAATERAQQTAQDRSRRVEAARGGPKLAELSEADLQSLISRYGEKSVQADAARAEMLRRGAPGRGASKRSEPLNLPSGYEVRRDRVHVAPGVTQLGSTFSAYGPDGRRVHHAARSESEAARMARKHHERATESERRHQEAAAARSAAAQVKQGEQAAWDARMAAGTARHKVTTDAIAERRKAEPILLRIRAGMLSKDDLTALADDPSAGRYERVAAHRALTALASRRLATATPAQLDQVESVAASAKGLAPSERDAFLRASAARRRKLKRGGR